MALTLIKTTTVGAGGAASLDFTNIPQTFTDLVIIASIRNGTGAGAQGGRAFKAIFNGSTSGRTTRWLNGNGSSASSATDDYFWATGSDSTANVFGNTSIYIPNYTGSTSKSYSIDSVGENNSTLAEMSLSAHLWANTAAITSISIMPTLVGNLAQGTTASLYGVSKNTTPAVAKATGGTISYGIGGYVYHTFTSSGTFTPTSSLTADVLVIGGGGAGGTQSNSNGGNAGGGGAGGVVAYSGVALSTTPNSVIVGAGGAGVSNSLRGNAGSSSFFGVPFSANGGGGGGSGPGAGSSQSSGGNGGSGGGGGGTASQGPGGSSTGGGNAGGTPVFNGAAWIPGGGGGAGGVGESGNNANGGIGTNLYAGWAAATGTGVSGYYAGGGGGSKGNYLYGNGGSGGGGNGITAGNGFAGTANTGSGGGADGNSGITTSGSGGSGVVIVRYKG